MNLILGDFNAKVGKGIRDELVGPYGLGERNERGERLYQFCQEEQMKITNTWFRLPPRRLYTWRAPADNPEHLIRNQIDYILINKRFGTSVTRTCTYPGADVPSDHVLLITEIKIKITNGRKQKQEPRIDYEKLKNECIKDNVSKKLNEALATLVIPQPTEETNPNNTWDSMEEIMMNTARTEIGYRQNIKRKNWMTNEILKMFEERRKYKNQGSRDKYRTLQNTIRRAVRSAKNKWLREQCEEMERLQKQNDDYNLHKKIKEAAGVYRKQTFSNIQNEKGQMAQDNAQRKSIWEQYIGSLFADERPQLKDNLEDDLTGPSITIEEITRAINSSKDKKAVGPDQVPVELLKLLDNEGIKIMQRLFNQIYNTGNFPSKWLTSLFVPLPKKNNTTRCEDHRLISLMSHTLKIFLKVIHYRISTKCESAVGSSQFGFRRGLGTREALVATQVLVQNCYDQRKDVAMCFIDYEKAFDRVRHQKLVQILRRLDIDQKDVRCIENLYWNQSAAVRVDNEITGAQQIFRGVRQGCVLSPLLFNLYSENIFQEALEGQEIGIKVNGIRINNIRYADDTVLIADNMNDLQTLLDMIGIHSRRMGIDINTKKTKFLIVTRKPDDYQNARLTHNGEDIERVKKFSYLGTWVCEDWSSDVEIKCRIEKARSAFMKFKNVLTNSDFDLDLRVRFTKCYVWSVLLYGMEGWTLKVRNMNRLEAFEMWVYRRILKIPWTARETNEEILRRMGRERELLSTIKRRKTAYLGHVMRNERYHLLQLIIEGKIEGRRGLGRKRMSWLRNVKHWTGIRTTGELIHATGERERWSELIANIH